MSVILRLTVHANSMNLLGLSGQYRQVGRALMLARDFRPEKVAPKPILRQYFEGRIPIPHRVEWVRPQNGSGPGTQKINLFRLEVV